MKGLQKFLGAAGVAFVAMINGDQSALASNPGFTVQYICPAGGFEYEVSFPPTGTPIPGFHSVTLPSFAGHEGSSSRCEENNFPRYRRFTHQEGLALDALVMTPEYLERRDWPYGKLSIWVEEQIVGRVHQGWAGKQTILDAYRVNAQSQRKLATFGAAKRREKKAESRLRAAFSAGLPNLIAGARASKKVGFDRARELADIAYLLHLDGRPDEARAWLDVSFRELNALPNGQPSSYGPKIREIAESISVCVESGEQHVTALCGVGGVYQFSREAVSCLRTSAARDCDGLVGWPKNADALATAIRDKRASDPLFKKLFDRAQSWSGNTPHHAKCDNHNALGLQCVPGPVYQVQKFDLSAYLPEIAAKLDNYSPSDDPVTLAHQLFYCERRGETQCLGGDTQVALETGRKLFPEFATTYNKLRNEEVKKMAERAAQCSAVNALLGPPQYCSFEPTAAEIELTTNQDYLLNFEKAKREVLEGYVEAFAGCRLADRLGVYRPQTARGFFAISIVLTLPKNACDQLILASRNFMLVRFKRGSKREPLLWEVRWR